MNVKSADIMYLRNCGIGMVILIITIINTILKIVIVKTDDKISFECRIQLSVDWRQDAKYIMYKHFIGTDK